MASGPVPPPGRDCLAIIRTHRFGQAEKDLAACLEPHFGSDLSFVFSTDDGRPDDVDYPSVMLDSHDLARLQLFDHPAWGWRCGDYALYRAAEALPGYNHYLMIEPDVFFTFDDLTGVFDRLAASDADLLAHRITGKPRDGLYRQNLLPSWHEVLSCRFPIVRTSRRLLALALEARQEMTRNYTGSERAHWPNDEVTIASTALAQGLKICDLADILGTETFGGTGGETFVAKARRVFHREEIDRCGMRNRIYHPVYRHDRYIAFLSDISLRKPDQAARALKRLRDVLPDELMAELEAACKKAGATKSG